MLGSLITSKTRLKLLIKFFVSATSRGHLRGLADEFDESTNAIRKELNQLSDAGYLNKEQAQNRVVYRANTHHPLFTPLQQLIRRYLGMDDLVDKVLERAGDVHQVVLVGDYAQGIEADHIEVVVVGDHLNSAYLLQLADKTSTLINKTVTITFDKPEQIAQIIIYQKDSGSGRESLKN